MKHIKTNLIFAIFIFCLGFGCQNLMADSVILDNGNKLSGIVTREGEYYVIEFSTGTIKIPVDRVRKVIREKSDLEQYYAKREKISDGDADAHYKLGIWARRHGLERQAGIEFRNALKEDPNHEKAHRALGHKDHNGKWLSREEYMRKKGYVKYDGKWVTPEVKEARKALEQREKLKEQEQKLNKTRQELEEAHREILRLKRELEQLRLNNERLSEDARKRRVRYHYPYGYYPGVDNYLFGVYPLVKDLDYRKNKSHHFRLRYPH